MPRCDVNPFSTTAVLPSTRYPATLTLTQPVPPFCSCPLGEGEDEAHKKQKRKLQKEEEKQKKRVEKRMRREEKYCERAMKRKAEHEGDICCHVQ